MILLQYWSVIEAIVIISIFAFILLKVIRSVRERRTNRVAVPKTLGGRIGFALLYALRIVGVGLGTFLAIAFGVMIERNIYSVITESMPAPSEVNTPPDLPFDVEEVTFEGGDDLMMAGWRSPITKRYNDHPVARLWRKSCSHALACRTTCGCRVWCADVR